MPTPPARPFTRGALRAFVVSQADFSKRGIDEARRLYAVAQGQGLRTTLPSMKQALYREVAHRRATGAPAAGPVAGPAVAGRVPPFNDLVTLERLLTYHQTQVAHHEARVNALQLILEDARHVPGKVATARPPSVIAQALRLDHARRRGHKAAERTKAKANMTPKPAPPATPKPAKRHHATLARKAGIAKFFATLQPNQVYTLSELQPLARIGPYVHSGYLVAREGEGYMRTAKPYVLGRGHATQP